jgi:signal transduction histidine kinase
MRLRPRHWAALDYVFGAFIVILLFAAVRPAMREQVVSPLGVIYSRQVPPPLDVPVALFLILGAGLATALRRRYPVLMLGVLLADSAALIVLNGPRGITPVTFLPVAAALFLVAATYERRRDAVWVLAAVFATLAADTELAALRGSDGFNQGNLVLLSLCMIIVWTAGYSMRQRRSYAVRLQEEVASKAVAQERLRIARELHDVVAHSMSVIAVQAGYGQYVMDSQPQDARDALGAIQATSREALDEMRRMLGALRQADDADARQNLAGTRPGEPGAQRADADTQQRTADPGPHDAGSAASPLFPAPGLADLDRLISRTAGAGVRVDLTRYGQPRDLPPSIDLSAYRIIQEALTNVVKHARTSSCRVLLGYRDDELTIEVTDDGGGLPVPGMASTGVRGQETAAPGGHGLVPEASRGLLMLDDAQAPPGSGVSGLAGGGLGSLLGGLPGAGHGIIGMRERVTLLGGEFSAGPLPGYGFRVSARIPVPSSSR